MKPILLFSTILTLMVINFSCLKDEVEAAKENPIKESKSFYTSDFDDIIDAVSSDTRNGDYSPFMSPITLVRYDIFPNILYVYNLTKIDSVKYKRISNSGHNYLGVNFNPYKTQIYYLDGSSETFESLSPSYLGTENTIIPNIANNQLENTNPEKFVIIDRTNRRTNDYNEKCGANRWKWFYDVSLSSGNDFTMQIEGLCNLSLDYSLQF